LKEGWIRVVEAGVPLISVVMAVYRPDPRHLEAQLNSVKRQDDPNFELVVRDDSADGGRAAALLESLLADFPHPCRVTVHARNMGSVRAFEALTRDAAGEFVAYCDQDDIWESDKLSALRAALTGNVTLAYCDMRFIDTEGAPIVKAKPPWRRRRGVELDFYLAYYNFVTGCAMMIRRETALKALPIPDSYVHDHWLALNAAHVGALAFVRRPLVNYRLHERNLIGIETMPGIWDKTGYVHRRLLPEKARITDSLRRFRDDPRLSALFQRRVGECEARFAFMERGNLWNLLRFLRRSRTSANRTLFEIAIGLLPVSLGSPMIKKLKHWMKR
jgi:glycosyltransferase involved in cell wall biosynthesis